jgi:ABC-type multidrug transport system ATPase subunit
LTEPAIRCQGLEHTWHTHPALSIPGLDLDEGRVHLAGPNGAGKTTLLRVLATLVTPTKGTALVDGHDVRTDARRVRSVTGYSGHAASLPASMPARQALTLAARLHAIPLDRVDAALDHWGLAHAAKPPVRSLSEGQRHRLDLARALLHEPDVVLLDEPGTGLDTDGIDALEQALDQAEPRIVLAAAPRTPGLTTDATIRLSDGRLEASP